MNWESCEPDTGIIPSLTMPADDILPIPRLSSTAPPDGNDSSFPKYGISLRGIMQFIGKTVDICRNIDINKTPDNVIMCIFFLFSMDVANVFLSFAYSDNFMDVIKSLKYFLESKLAHEHKSLFIWISMFSVDKNKAAELSMEWWSGTFKRSIGCIGHVVLVALAWKNPTTLERAWCLWEIFCTIEEQSKFDIANERIFSRKSYQVMM